MAITDVTDLKDIIKEKLGGILSNQIASVEIEQASLLGENWFTRVMVKYVNMYESPQTFDIVLNSKTGSVVSFTKVTVF